ncbi:MAG: CBS domain-containing protein [Anaerolineae bacterium]|nr:CBS domain-containing protein [Anaerolineae bacterium]
MLTVSDLMTFNPKTVTPMTPLTEIQRLMRAEGCRHLPVVENGRLIGIITDRDLRAVVNTPVFAVGSAETVMTSNPITVSPGTPAHRAAEMLNLYKFNSLPVVDHGVLVGIVTSSDFLAQFTEHELRSDFDYSPGEF